MTREWCRSAAENVLVLLAPIVAGYASGRATMYAIRHTFGLGDLSLLRIAGCIVGVCIGVWLLFAIEGTISGNRQKHGRLSVGHSTAWGRKYL